MELILASEQLVPVPMLPPTHIPRELPAMCDAGGAEDESEIEWAKLWPQLPLTRVDAISKWRHLARMHSSYRWRTTIDPTAACT